MKQIRFDFNNLLSSQVGSRHGIDTKEIKRIFPAIFNAHEHLRSIISDKRNRISLGLEWAYLPFQDRLTVKEIQKLGSSIAKKYDNVLFLGIGGSYLGLKAAQDALSPAYYNDFSSQRKGMPKIYFEGNNLDPETIKVLLKNLNPAKTFVVVISKSGETTETKAAFLIVQDWLKRKLGRHYGRAILAITDPESGALRKIVNAEQTKDKLSFRSLPLLKGVGGRFSEFNMGLLHLAIAGINLHEVLGGAKDMSTRCSRADVFKNPAYMYAVLSYLLYQKKHKTISVMMPFCEGLKSSADWYVQLLAESLGKKYARKIKHSENGAETWETDREALVEVGRTPISCRGTQDLHSVQQNNIEGENNKVITFIKVENFPNDILISAKGDFLDGKSFGKLLSLAQEATVWALVRGQRPNCTVVLPEISPYHWGGLLFFLQMATAFEGELLNVNAFDQPGVEGYKNYMYYKLRRPGIAQEIIDEIEKHPLRKNPKFIL